MTVSVSNSSGTSEPDNGNGALKVPLVSGTLVSNEAILIFRWACYLVCGIIDLFGTLTNIINIVCFVKQGFKDSVNVSLLALAISDLGCLLTLLWTSISFIPAFHESDLPFDSVEVQYLVTAWPHVIFTRVTSCITALITVERCVCITMPMKVKNIFTTRRVTISIVCIFIILTCSVSPVYYANRLAWRFSPPRNRTILGLAFTDDRIRVEQISFAINNVFIPFSAFIIITVCTITLVINLREKTKWRLKSMADTQAADSTNERDQKVAKMILVISTLFIACFIPSGIIFTAMLVVPDLNVGRKYQNTLVVVYGLGLVLESMNSSFNIFIYYQMSSKFRSLFDQLFSRKRYL